MASCLVEILIRGGQPQTALTRRPGSSSGDG
jgi:hypothetical protein